MTRPKHKPLRAYAGFVGDTPDLVTVRGNALQAMTAFRTWHRGRAAMRIRVVYLTWRHNGKGGT